MNNLYRGPPLPPGPIVAPTPPAAATISYKRSPFQDDPQYIDGYPLVRQFYGIRGRVCYVYRDTTTGEEIYAYGPLTRTVI